METNPVSEDINPLRPYAALGGGRRLDGLSAHSKQELDESK